ncbi:hypothetical protein [Hyunsoonleella rubra]|uniref:Lipoprotein n=1 Tax=Hyunsoonleella rubra TaxID=1737062 RepID=A0ABW5TAY7_9FLAO
MMKIYLRYLSIILIFVSCSKDNDILWYDAEVLGESIDCPGSFLLQFDESPNSMISIDNIFVETNLSENYKLPGLKLKVQTRELSADGDEFKVCTTLAPGYSGVFILSALQRE